MEEENKVNEENESQNTVKDFTYPSFWGRAGAYILDGLILLPVNILFDSMIKELYTNENMLYLSVIVSVIFSFLFNFYRIFFNTKFNGTPGKLLCKFKIYREDGMPVTWETSIKREAIYIVLSLFGFLVFYKFFFTHRAEINTFALANSLFSKSIGATITTWISFIICLFDFGKALFSPKRITFHDKIAGTVVVYKPV